MKNVYFKTKILLTLPAILLAMSAFSQESLVITSGEVKLTVGDSVQLTAEYTDVDSVVQEVMIEWYTEPAELAAVSETDILKAQQAGKGFLFAKYEELLDSVEIEIEAVEEEEEEIEEDDSAKWGTLTILNNEIELEPGETVQLEAEYADTSGIVQDVRIKWHTDPGYLGKVDKNGLLTAGHPGEGMLFAKYRDLRDSIAVKVNGIPKGENDTDSIDYPKVKVIPGMIRIAAGDSVELVAFYINENDEKVDTTFSWSVWPADLGEFPDSAQNKFVAGEETGKGVIIATLGDLADTVKLNIIEPKTWPNRGNNSRRISILPGDTVVQSGDLTTIQYTAEYKTNGKKHEDADLLWSISGAPVGSIDSTGLLTLSGETGLALIKAEYSNFSASVELLVVDSLVDSEINSITIHRVLPDGHELPAKSFDEGDSYKIGGLPFPLNILNGGTLHFPVGCIDEDIVIYMFIPEEYAEVDEDSAEVAFDGEIITGVKFSVKPADSVDIIEPYYFNIPLNLSMVFKHELLDSLGIEPEQLDVFFADSTGFVTDGTDNVAIDTVRNKIHAAIEHFSTIVVKPKSAQTYVPDLIRSKDRLNVYPNPFRNSTKISFNLESNSNINIEIYNIVGQKVINLVNGYYTKGTHVIDWDGKNDTGKLCDPGIYFCRMSKNGKQSVIKKILYNR